MTFIFSSGISCADGSSTGMLPLTYVSTPGYSGQMYRPFGPRISCIYCVTFCKHLLPSNTSSHKIITRTNKVHSGFYMLKPKLFLGNPFMCRDGTKTEAEVNIEQIPILLTDWYGQISITV